MNGLFSEAYLLMILSEKVTSTKDFGAIDSAFIGSVGVWKSIINYTANGEKYTLQKMVQIRTMSKSSVFNQYNRVDSMLCALCVHVCVRVFKMNTRGVVQKNTGLTQRIGAKIYSEKNSVRM